MQKTQQVISLQDNRVAEKPQNKPSILLETSNQVLKYTHTSFFSFIQQLPHIAIINIENWNPITMSPTIIAYMKTAMKYIHNCYL